MRLLTISVESRKIQCVRKVFFTLSLDYPGGTMNNNPTVNARDMGLTLVWEDSTCHRATKPLGHNH